MVVRKRKKAVRLRGSKTHGWGAMKKHRGKGNKGGAGMAGTGKRGDAKKPSIWKEKYFGMHKFIAHNSNKPVKSTNIIDIERKFERLLKSGIIKKQGERYEFNLKDIGFNKLLSKGSLNHKMKITVEQASAKTVEKVKKSGSEIVLTKKIKEPKNKDEAVETAQ